MDGQHLRIGFCALLAGFLAQGDALPRGYLPRVGPAPLRFRPLPIFGAPLLVLPPLPVPEPAPATNTSKATYTSEPAEPTAPATPSTEVLTAGTTNSPPTAPSAEPEFPIGTPNGTQQVTPQMLIDYFRGGPGESNGVQVIAPLNSFIPPVWTAPPPPPSSATYKSN